MHKINKCILLFSLILILFISITSISASNFDIESNTTLNSVNNEYGVVDEVSSSTDDNLNENALSSSSSFNDNLDNRSIYRVNQRNFKMYFEENTLKPEYANSTIVFDGKFDNFGIIKVYSKDTVITANHAIFNNTVFDLGASGIILSNVNMIINEEFSQNNYAGIYIHSDNVTVHNCNLNYTVPGDVTAFGIYCDGHKTDYSGLNIIDNTLSFKSNSVDINSYNYAILLRNIHDCLVLNNTIDCELPIRYIPYGLMPNYGSATINTVAAFAGDYCENLTLSNNYIRTSVRAGDTFYPTLDTVILYGGSHFLIEKNTIISEDYFTKTGQDNYLQALDIHVLNDLTIINNDISVFTNGGKSGMGTAYSIQINGPVYDAKIAFNRLTTYNHGPNCAIYSQNYYGDTYIDIISNFINVTGDATNEGTNPSWCLVSGIEVQDTKDNILNNTIIVNNLGNYKSSANVYGISYVQNTGGGHSYNIQFNNITTNGNYGVKLIGKVKDSTTDDSTVSNNVINTRTSSKRTGASTNGQVEGPGGTTIKNNTNGVFKRQMSTSDLPDWLKNYMDNGAGYKVPDLTWIERSVNPNSQGSGFGNNPGNGNGMGNNRGNSKGLFEGNNPGLVSGSGNRDDSSNMKGNLFGKSNKGDVDGDRNSTMWTYGVSGSSLAASSVSSPSDVGSSASDPNAYEIDEVESVAKTVTSWNSYILVVVFMLLLIIGYKYRKEDEET